MSSLWPNRLSGAAQRAEIWAPRADAAALEAEAFARGFEEGRSTIEAEVAGERAALVMLFNGLEALEAPSSTLIATMIVTAVERLVTDICGSAAVDHDLLVERAHALARFIGDHGEVTIALHPDDMALVAADRIAITCVADPSLARGTVQARCDAGAAEDGVPQALGRLHAAIAELGLAS